LDLDDMEEILNGWSGWFWAICIVAGVVAFALILHAVTFAVLKRLSARTSHLIDEALVRHSRRPARFAMVLGALAIALPALPVDTVWMGYLRHALGLGVIAAVAWNLTAGINVAADIISMRHRIDVKNNLQARRIRTQTRVLQRTVSIIITMVAIAVMLMTFPEVRRIGEGLFASAGLAAIIAGIAARSTLANLFAGIQIALTEPIRLDDVVIVEGEWGKVEEIGPAFVIVQLWDQRRMVVPLTYFIEEPFENWTRQTANLLGTVYLYTDYNVPVDELRRQFKHILDTSDLWDGEVWNLQVTNSNDQSVELRAIMSAPDSSVAWDLRCHVRERLIAYLQERYPESLPRTRADVRPLDSRQMEPAMAGGMR
jgi:small-conductance mechanosensitive channel